MKRRIRLGSMVLYQGKHGCASLSYPAPPYSVDSPVGIARVISINHYSTPRACTCGFDHQYKYQLEGVSGLAWSDDELLPVRNGARELSDVPKYDIDELRFRQVCPYKP